MTRRIAIAMQKGGVGKSTTAINLTSSLAFAEDLAQENDVLLVDADPQGFVTITLGYQDEYVGEDSLYDVITDIDKFHEVNDLIVSNDSTSFDVLPAHGKNFKLEKELWSLSRTKERLSMVLDEINHDYDYIVIDSPPNMGPLADGSLLAAENVLFVSKADTIATFSMKLLLEEKNKLEKEFGRDIGIIGAVVNMISQNKINEDRLDWFYEFFGEENMFIVPDTVAIEGAFSQGSTVYDFEPENRHREQKAKEVREIYNNIAQQVDEYFAKAETGVDDA